VICTNTMHKVAGAIESASRAPLLHIADATAAAVRRAGVARVGLLGTRFTMEEPFYRRRMEERHGLEVLVPAPPTGSWCTPCSSATTTGSATTAASRPSG